MTDAYRPRSYGTVAIVPFETEGPITPAEADEIRGWVELALLRLNSRIISWAEIEERILEVGGKEDRGALLGACRDAGAKGLWNARARVHEDKDGMKELTLVLRLTDLKTRKWVLELHGQDHMSPSDDSPPAWQVWVAMIEAMIDEIPPSD